MVCHMPRCFSGNTKGRRHKVCAKATNAKCIHKELCEVQSYDTEVINNNRKCFHSPYLESEHAKVVVDILRMAELIGRIR